jgi:hypothetical protein
MSIDEPEDLHFALFVRDACGVGGSAAPGPLCAPPSLAHSVPAGERAGLAAAWEAWWQALLAAHQATSGRPPEGLTPQQRMEWLIQPREYAGAPPDFVGLAHAPILQAAAARCWQEGFRQWWAPPRTAEPSLDLPGLGIGGTRGDLIAAIMTSSRAHVVNDVVSEVEGSIGRKAAPFDLGLDVLAVEGDEVTQLTPNYALVPIGLFTDVIRYRQWLRQTIVPLA